MFKKILSVILSVLMITSMLIASSVTAAADTDQEQTAGAVSGPLGDPEPDPEPDPDPDPEPEPEPEPQVNPFTDVPEVSWYTESVIFCYYRDYMKGTNETTFSPSGTVTRAMFVTVLAKIDGADVSDYTTTSFADIESGKWYTKTVEWAYQNEFTSGTGTDPATGKPIFGHSLNVTRQQLATFFRTYSSKKGIDVSTDATLNYYLDACLVAGWAEQGMIWAVDFGLLSGVGEATLAPRNQCTRAQLAVITKKFVEFIESDCEHDWTEPTCTEGRVCRKCGYTRGTPLGHDCDVSCTKSATCRRCGKKIEAFGHYFITPPTCTTGATCERCKQVIGPLGHDYVPSMPTCTEGAKCTRCGKVLSPLGHTTDNGVCERCGADVFPTKFAQLCYYIIKNGEYNKSQNAYMVSEIQMFQDGATYIQLVYFPDAHVLVFSPIWYLRNDDIMTVTMEMYGISDSYEFTCSIYDQHSDDLDIIGEGKVYPATIAPGGKVSFTKYYGTSSEKTSWINDYSRMITEGLTVFKNRLEGKKIIGGVTLQDLGFKKY